MAAMLSSSTALAPTVRFLNARARTSAAAPRAVPGARVVSAARVDDAETTIARMGVAAIVASAAAVPPARADELEAPADVGDAAAAAADATAAATADAAAAAADAASRAASRASDAAAALASKVGGLTGSASDTLGSSASKLGDAAAGALGGAAKSAAPVLGGAAKAVGSGAGALGAGLGAASSAASQASSAASSSAAQAAQQVTAATSGVASGLVSALPPEFADLVGLAEKDSDVALALAAALAAAPLALSSLVAAARGYSGDVNAFVLDEKLAKDKRAFLVDTRAEAQRAADGVPDLRGAARARGAAVPVEPLDESTRRRTKGSARALELELAAKKVAVLTKNDARVYVMGPDAGALARAVEALPGNRAAFVLSGGFEAWRGGGLRVRANGRYEKNALDVVGEKTSAAATAFTRRVSAAAGTAKTTLVEKEPLELLPLGLGAAGVAAAALNYHVTLQFLGVLGVELTLINKALAYDSPAAILEDVKDAVLGLAESATATPAPRPPAKADVKAPEPAPKPAPAPEPEPIAASSDPAPAAPTAKEEQVMAETKEGFRFKQAEAKPIAASSDTAPAVPAAKEEQVMAETKEGFRFKQTEAKPIAALPEEEIEQKKDM